MNTIFRSKPGKKALVFVLVMAALVSLMLASCGGGGGGGDTAPVSYSISGQVTSGGNGLEGVTVTPSAGTAATTDASGNYTITGLVNGTYTITPGKSGFTFTPTSSSKTVANANIAGADFVATAATASVLVVSCPSTGFEDIVIADFSFSPTPVTVSVNRIVKWTNSGNAAHTVSSGTSPAKDNKFDSGSLSKNQTFCVQFLTAGSYPYFCEFHASSMKATVTVQ